VVTVLDFLDVILFILLVLTLVILGSRFRAFIKKGEECGVCK
jgi:hypothetical protein